MLVTELLFIKKSLTTRKPVIRNVTSLFIKKSAPTILKSDLIIDGDVVVPLLSHVQHFVTPWTAACQASLYSTISMSLLKLMSVESVIPSKHFILLLLPPNPSQHQGLFQ